MNKDTIIMTTSKNRRIENLSHFVRSFSSSGFNIFPKESIIFNSLTFFLVLPLNTLTNIQKSAAEVNLADRIALGFEL